MRNPRVRSRNFCFNESSRWFWYMLKSKIHWSILFQNFPLTLPFYLWPQRFQLPFSSCKIPTHKGDTALPSGSSNCQTNGLVLGDIELPWGMPFLIGQPHYFSVLRSHGSQILVRPATLAQIVLVTCEGMIKSQTISLRWELAWMAPAARSGWPRGLAWGSDTYRIRLCDKVRKLFSALLWTWFYYCFCSSILLTVPRWSGHSGFLYQGNRICQSRARTSEEAVG